MRLDDPGGARWGGAAAWTSRSTNIGRDLLRGPWAASRPGGAQAEAAAPPTSLTAAELADSLGNMRRELAVRNRQAPSSLLSRMSSGWIAESVLMLVCRQAWGSALPREDYASLPPDVGRRKRKADLGAAIRAGKRLLRRGRQAVEVAETVEGEGNRPPHTAPAACRHREMPCCALALPAPLGFPFVFCLSL